MKRNITLDITRTLAIILMVIFHFIYDLKFFGFADLQIPDEGVWVPFRWLIISLFFLCLGVSLSFAHADVFRAKKFTLRLAQISLAALVISIATYFAINKNWIFFGVLHFLALSSLLVISFVRFPRICFVLGLIIFSIGALQLVPSRWPFHLLFDNLPRYTNDFVAIFPWLALVFWGVTLSHTKWLKSDPLAKIFNDKPYKSTLLWPGQHSLSIYLLHQPLMMGTLYLLRFLLRPAS